jgi:hypothetical protein
MSGVAQKSGPPGNCNANGNPGGGPPNGNGNAVTHGVYHYLATGELPSDCQDIAAAGLQLRQDLLRATNDRHNGVSVTRAEIIDSVVTHDVIRRLLVRFLTARRGELDIDRELVILRDIGKAIDRRGSRLKELDLDSRNTADIWAVLDSPKTTPTDSQSDGQTTQ